MDSFIAHSDRAYKEPTLEFLATLELVPVEEQYRVQFQLFNEFFDRSLEESNVALDFDPHGDILDLEPYIIPEYDQNSWWEDISRVGEFITKDAKISIAYQPCLRVVHRLLG